MECEGDPFGDHAHGIAFWVGGKFGVAGFVKEVDERFPVGEDPVVVEQVFGLGLGEFHVGEVIGPVVGEVDGTVHVGEYEIGEAVVDQVVVGVVVGLFGGECCGGKY